MGTKLGALTGALGFGMLAAALALWTAFRSGKEIHDAFLNYFQQNAAAQGSDPRVQQVIELFNTPEGFAFIMIFSLIMTLVAFLIFSSLGGAIGAFLLHRKGQHVRSSRVTARTETLHNRPHFLAIVDRCANAGLQHGDELPEKACAATSVPPGTVE